MDDDQQRIIRIEDKIDKVVDHMGTMNSTLSAQHVSLVEHIRRTELLEEKVKPLESAYLMGKGALKVAAAIVATAGVLEAIITVINYLRKG